jgi:hypothetical protein
MKQQLETERQNSRARAQPQAPTCAHALRRKPLSKDACIRFLFRFLACAL